MVGKLIAVFIVVSVILYFAYDTGYDNAKSAMIIEFNAENARIRAENERERLRLLSQIKTLETASDTLKRSIDDAKQKIPTIKTEYVEKIVNVQVPVDCRSITDDVSRMFVEAAGIISDPRMPGTTETKTN